MLTGCHVAKLRHWGLRAYRLALSYYFVLGATLGLRVDPFIAIGDGASRAHTCCHGVMSTRCLAATCTQHGQQEELEEGQEEDNRWTRKGQEEQQQADIGQKENRTARRRQEEKKRGQREDKWRTRSGDRLAAAAKLHTR